MLLYNQLHEFDSLTAVALVIIAYIILLVVWLLFRFKPTGRGLAVCFIVSVCLTLLGTLVVQGGYSGTLYREQFGWPLVYLHVHRFIGFADGPTAVPVFPVLYEWKRFAVDVLYWSFFPLVVWLGWSVTNKQDKRRVVAAGAGVGFILITALAYFIVHQHSRYPQRVTSDTYFQQETQLIQNSSKQPLPSYILDAISTAYPEFANFEQQPSFAGRQVVHLTQDYDTFVAFLTLGSGVPVVEGTCFHIDHSRRVFKTGVFGDPLDSRGFGTVIDPRSCQWVR